MAASGLMPPPVRDSDVQQYVSALTRRLAVTSDLKTPLQATVLDSREISAIGLPGGFLFVTSGLVLAAGDESELAGMMSRQIASIAAHHRLRAGKRSILSRLLVPAAQITTGVFTGGVSNAGAYYGMNYGFQGLGALVDKTFAARDERFQKEADQLGIQYAWNAGFDPSGFIAFLDTIARERSQPGAAAFFGAPDLAARILDAFSEIQHLPAKPILADDSVAFQSAKQRLQKSVKNEE
jgi:predicted Zn-dependent protease